MSTDKYSLQSKWGELIGSEPYTQIPNVLLHSLAKLNLSSTEAIVLITIIMCKFDDRKPFPSAEYIAARIGKNVHTVRTNVVRLEKKGMLKRDYRIGSSNEYDLDPLRNQLELIINEDPGYSMLNTPEYADSNTPMDITEQAHYSKPNTEEDAVNKTPAETNRITINSIGEEESEGSNDIEDWCPF